MLSTILDISSFFIGMLINLLLIALICYYFKRKYESLELAQNEQAKILYNLIQSQTPRKQFDIADIMKTNFISNTVEKSQCVIEECDSDSDSSESDSESESEPETENDVKVFKIKETEVIELDEEDPPFVVTKVVDTKVAESKVENNTVSDTNVVESESISEVDYSKMTIKELKDVLSKKGISSNPRMKKNDLIQLIEVGVSDVLNLSEELNEVNI